MADTTAALQGAGLVQAGLPGQIGIVTDGTTKVAFVDFAPYPNTNNLLDLPTAKSLILQAKSEANVVVVYMHAGAEGSDADHVTGSEETYVGEDRGNAKAFAHAAIDDGADLVIASGPHVLRGMEEYNGHLIAYSLGNFCGYQNFATGGTLSLSGILTVTMTGNGVFTGGHFTSLLLNGVGQPSVDPSGEAGRLRERAVQRGFRCLRRQHPSFGTDLPPGAAAPEAGHSTAAGRTDDARAGGRLVDGSDVLAPGVRTQVDDVPFAAPRDQRRHPEGLHASADLVDETDTGQVPVADRVLTCPGGDVRGVRR